MDNSKESTIVRGHGGECQNIRSNANPALRATPQHRVQSQIQVQMARQEEAQPQTDVMEIPPRVKDLTGQRFGKWVVQEFAGRNKLKKIQWMCLCDCGKTKVVTGDSLSYGTTTSCGCSRGRKGARQPCKDKQPSKAAATPSAIEQQGYAWRTENAASPLNNKKLEQHPNGLWKYPGSYVSHFVPLPPHLVPPSFEPNYKRIHRGLCR
ncbi:hypothetical protein H6G17_09965 [Chroococcidiopsis sp. FACHB-1243]|uniref:hypothetical protein n=1 Tax=Chroococcidiopsis sp. [FACHB-1243] TaxID=2692781 RepID=UPI001782B05F|nr:hypothetical protein [Chroococcidiopsis sp. [FACHB-1243]]MBD2305837.1 hypothetical protein [Chroococcidiopsis sp. [FACHB-1243]]